MDSVETDPIFDELFVHGLQNPDAIEQECDAVVSQLRSTLVESKKNSDLLTTEHDLDADDVRKWRDHPAQFWLERAITSGLAARGGSAIKAGNAWRVKWADGSESAQACFDARTADENPELEWVTMEDPRARAVIKRAAALCRWPAAAGDPRDRSSGLGTRHLVAVGDQFGG